MKADLNGPPTEQKRWRAGWQTARRMGMPGDLPRSWTCWSCVSYLETRPGSGQCTRFDFATRGACGCRWHMVRVDR